jgi:hypothetical protein
MFREINDADRTGYAVDDNGKKVGTIKVNGYPQIIGNCKYIEIDDDTKQVVSIRKELPKDKPKATVAKKPTKKPTKKQTKGDK